MIRLTPENKRILGREFALAQKIIDLAKGDGTEHRQECPICGGDDTFYFKENKTPWGRRNGTFHCDRCGFNGGLYVLIREVRPDDSAFDLVSQGLKSTRRKTTSLVRRRKLLHGVRRPPGGETGNIMAMIRRLDKEVSVAELQEEFPLDSKYRQKGGEKKLERKLNTMVDVGILDSRLDDDSFPSVDLYSLPQRRMVVEDE